MNLRQIAREAGIDYQRLYRRGRRKRGSKRARELRLCESALTAPAFLGRSPIAPRQPTGTTRGWGQPVCWQRSELMLLFWLTRRRERKAGWLYRGLSTKPSAFGQADQLSLVPSALGQADQFGLLPRYFGIYYAEGLIFSRQWKRCRRR